MSALPTFASTIQQILATPKPGSAGNWLGAFGKSPAVQAFANATDQANLANFNRGQQGIGLLAGMGNASKAENTQNYQQALGGIDQDLVSRGLYNTSAVTDAKLGAARDLTRQNNLVDQNTAGSVANTLLSFQDQAPNVGILSQLLQNINSQPKTDPYGETLNSRWGVGGKLVQLNNGMWKNMETGMVQNSGNM